VRRTAPDVGRRRASRPARTPQRARAREGAHLTPALPDMTLRQLRAVTEVFVMSSPISLTTDGIDDIVSAAET
jgi:hypothetical protein